MSSKVKLYKHWYLIALRGILIIIMGVFSFMYDKEVKVPFIKVFEIFMIVSGLLMIQLAILNRHHINWQWILINGFLDLSFGLMLWLVPEIAGKTVPLVLGIWFLYSGILHIGESLVLIHDNIKNWWFELIAGLGSFIMAFVLVAARVKLQKEIFVLIGILAVIHGLFIAISSLVLFEPDEYLES